MKYIPGILEIDHDRGVIYFHRTDKKTMQTTMLRICRLGIIPKNVGFIDITHMHGLQWTPLPSAQKKSTRT